MNPDYVDSKIIAKVSKRHAPPPLPALTPIVRQKFYIVFTFCASSERDTPITSLTKTEKFFYKSKNCLN